MFYTHAFEALIIIAILFTIIGYCIGASVWRGRKILADRLEELNEALNKKNDALKEDQEKLEKILNKTS